MTREELEAEILEYPVMQYAYLETKNVEFVQRVREICKNECPRYGSTWSCPPAVGTVDECRDRCSKFKNCFVFCTVAEVEDITNMDQTLPTRMEHEEVTHAVVEIFRKHYGEVIGLSTESCDRCKKCTYPEGTCRQPDKMFPCVESYGILVTDLAEQGGLEFANGANVVTWFSVIFYNED